MNITQLSYAAIVLALLYGQTFPQAIAQKNTADSLPTGKYAGNYRLGKRHGKGTFIWADGSQYTGMWRNDLMEGYGVYTGADGTTYEGQWLNGKRHGYGVYTWPNGDRYVGEFLNDKRHGTGKLTIKDGGSHEGTWTNDEPNGYGVRIWASGAKYMGDWKMGKRHGRGVMIYPDGRIEQGDFANDNYIPCKCTDSILTVQTAFQRSDAVFHGKITNFIDMGVKKYAIFDVIQLWKGVVLQERNIYVEVGFSSCDWLFFKGEEYLIYATANNDYTYTTNLCTRSQLIGRAAYDLEILSNMECVKNPGDVRSLSYVSTPATPVCGCDGMTYRNPVEALRHGITQWKAGKCQIK
ncbi:MAG: hypothetical protein RMJ44_00420 [Cytophagales bacterium]|nr:hypothetical protein [Bernardetiaceae bacterium]MDW8209522.1 hypothetical protein [Cytophagales bacterium]